MIKLYYAPGACSMSVRISLHEAGLAADFERVDLKSKLTESGADFLGINPKGYVPALVLDNGAVVTEIDAVLDLVADWEPALRPGGTLGRTRLIEMLSYLSTEMHIAFKPLWHDASEAEKAKARDAVARRFAFLEGHIAELYLFGPRFTVADPYFFVMLRWARKFDIPLSAHLTGYFERVLEHESVRRALVEEGFEEQLVAAPIPLITA